MVVYVIFHFIYIPIQEIDVVVVHNILNHQVKGEEKMFCLLEYVVKFKTHGVIFMFMDGKHLHNTMKNKMNDQFDMTHCYSRKLIT